MKEARRICLMRSRNPPHGLQGIRPAGKRKNAGERHAEKSPAPAADQRAASLSKAHEDLEPAWPPAAARALSRSIRAARYPGECLFVDDLHPAVIAREGDFVRAVQSAARAPGIAGAPGRA